jgi:hypothetical protein
VPPGLELVCARAGVVTRIAATVNESNTYNVAILSSSWCAFA